MANISRKEKKEKTIFEKIGVGFTCFCILYLILKFTGLLESIVAYFK
ncbi:hypothetical protein ACFQZ1_10005 [Bacillus sp. CGMCC 1.60114]